MTRADRLYRVWLERELGHITTEEAWERADEILDRYPVPLVRPVPPFKPPYDRAYADWLRRAA